MKKYSDLLIPNEYVHSIYDVDYDLKRENGIKYALFDLDGTVVPFDSVEVDESHIEFFDSIKEKGIKPAFYSDGSLKRIKPIIKYINIPYIYRAKKPFGTFKRIELLFGDDCNKYNTMLIGNINFLDTVFANRLGIYNILVDTVKSYFNIKEIGCEIGDKIITYPIRNKLKEYGVKRY